jgi:hypothetical protein
LVPSARCIPGSENGRVVKVASCVHFPHRSSPGLRGRGAQEIWFVTFYFSLPFRLTGFAGKVFRKSPNLLSVQDPRSLPLLHHRNTEKGTWYNGLKLFGILGIGPAAEHREARKRVAAPVLPPHLLLLLLFILTCGNVVHHYRRPLLSTCHQRAHRGMDQRHGSTHQPLHRHRRNQHF